MSEVIFIPYAQSYTPVSDVRLDLYWDPVDGEDTNDGLSTTTPVQTAARLMQLLPLPLKRPVLVHCSSGVFDFSNAPIPSLAGSERMLCLYGDFDWDPRGDLLSVDLADVAGVGTDGSDIVLSAPVTQDQYLALSIRFVDGAAAGQIRTVNQHTTTSLTPTRAFSPAPVAGDSFEVFRSNALIDGARLSFDNPGSIDGTLLSNTSGIEPGLSFVNFTKNNTVLSAIGSGYFLGYGILLTSANNFSLANAQCNFGAQANEGVGVLARQMGLPQHLWAGWGYGTTTLNISAPFFLGSCSIDGYFVVNGQIAIPEGTFIVRGGSARGITATPYGSRIRVFGTSTTLPFILGAFNESNSLINRAINPSVCLGWIELATNVFVRVPASANPALLCQGPGVLTISTTVLGGNPGVGPTLRVLRGFRVFTAGVLNLGRGAADPNPNDIEVETTAAVNKTFFAAAGTTLFDATRPGAVIQRSL
jgi:hypothetical protein